LKIERLLAIVVLLLNRRRITARELAERFEVSVRTIYRDVASLAGAGIPVVTTQGHDGGLMIPDNYKLSRQLLTFEDMVAILTTLKGVNATLKNQELARVIEKITALIPEEKEALYQTHANSLVIDISPWGMTDGNEKIVQLVHSAINRAQVLTFTYTSASGQISRRVAEPHALVNKSFTWYLLAYCRMRQDFRVFRLSRLRQPSLLSEHFLRRETGPIECFFRPKEQPRVMLTLKFKAAARIKVEEHFPPNSLTTLADGSLVVKTSFPEDQWILAYLLSFGSEVEVLSPPTWRRMVYEKSREIENIYSNMT
jgi:predicted DNA-binding transcriptional regulator YafY